MAINVTFDVSILYKKLRKVLASDSEQFCRYSHYTRIYTDNGFLYFRLFRITGDFVDICLTDKKQQNSLDIVVDFYALCKKLFDVTKEVKKEKDLFINTIYKIPYTEEDEIVDLLHKDNIVTLKLINDVCIIIKKRNDSFSIKTFSKEDIAAKNNSFCVDILFGDPTFSKNHNREHICCLSIDIAKKLLDIFTRQTENTSSIVLNNERNLRWLVYFYKTANSEKILKVGVKSFIVLDLNKMKDEICKEKHKNNNFIVNNTSCSIYLLKDLNLIYNDRSDESSVVLLYNVDYGWFCDIPNYGRLFSMSKYNKVTRLPKIRSELVSFMTKHVAEINNQLKSKYISFDLSLYDYINIFRTIMVPQRELCPAVSKEYHYRTSLDPLKNKGEFCIDINNKNNVDITFSSVPKLFTQKNINNPIFVNHLNFHINNDDLAIINEQYSDNIFKKKHLISIKNCYIFANLFFISGFFGKKEVVFYCIEPDNEYVLLKTANKTLRFNIINKTDDSKMLVMEYSAIKIYFL